MKKFLGLLFVAMLCIGFTGCTDEKDKDDDKGKKSKIVGIWNNYKDWDIDYGYDDYSNGIYGVCFKENGTGYWTYYGEIDEYFDWKISGSTLRFDYGLGDIESAEIETLSNDELILSYDHGDNREYYERIR
ncbi:MAG: hypothetical protein IKV33_05265 [Alistipes sp.]|nr:hypothetical protein [Alistipes sp.]